MFKFRLQTVLNIREIELEAAERAYLLAKSKREDAEQDLQGVHLMLANTKRKPRESFQERLDAQSYSERLEDEARAISSTIGVLQDEESVAMNALVEARKEVKTLEKLREKAIEEFNLELNRKEQAELDEWATLRRTAC